MEQQGKHAVFSIHEDGSEEQVEEAKHRRDFMRGRYDDLNRKVFRNQFERTIYGVEATINEVVSLHDQVHRYAAMCGAETSTDFYDDLEILHDCNLEHLYTVREQLQKEVVQMVVEVDPADVMTPEQEPMETEQSEAVKITAEKLHCAISLAALSSELKDKLQYSNVEQSNVQPEQSNAPGPSGVAAVNPERAMVLWQPQAAPTALSAGIAAESNATGARPKKVAKPNNWQVQVGRAGRRVTAPSVQNRLQAGPSRPYAVASRAQPQQVQQRVHQRRASWRSDAPMYCLFCRNKRGVQEKHQLYRCEHFLRLDLAERRRLAISWTICVLCLRYGHDKSECDQPECPKCKHPHNSILCGKGHHK